MGKLVQFVTPLHLATSRAYIDRMVDDKVHCMLKAKEYEADYWDGDRRYGYGGYKYMPDRWKPVAEALIHNYNLTNDSNVLDVGCGKAYLLYEMKLLLPGLKGLIFRNTVWQMPGKKSGIHFFSIGPRILSLLKIMSLI